MTTIRYWTGNRDTFWDGTEAEQMEAYAARRQARDLFVASMRDYAADERIGWLGVMNIAAHCYDLDGHAESPLITDIYFFRSDYGYPDLLRALAQAIEADDVAKQEAMDRR